MSPETAKYIRLCNLLALLLLIAGVMAIVHNLAGGRAGALVFLLPCEFCLMLTLFLNHRGHYTSGRVMVILIWNMGLLYAVTTNQSMVLPHYPFFITTAASILIFPKKEFRIMIVMVITCAVFYHLGLFSRKFYQSMEPAIGLERAFYDYTLYLGLILITAIGRSGAIQAEERLAGEREKVSRLSERLKLYLPRQFVQAIAGGDPAAPTGYRRRRLTIFFSDVQGFTQWTDRMEPEEVHEILNRYLSEMSAIAQNWGGTVDKFIGDALMIFFGDPEFTDDRDHALRCVRMAMDMQNKMTELRQDWEDRGYLEQLRIRIGIHTGYATVGDFGSGDRLNYTALGGAVNLASRLESACAPDKITISHATWALVKDEIECELKGEIEVKGFTEPVKIYEVGKAGGSGPDSASRR